MHTFKVNDVKIGRKILSDRASKGVPKYEQVAFNHDLAEFRGDNGLIATLATAYDDHLPLVLSPDDIWLAIAQGFAQHVGIHAESLRSRLGIKHEGKKTLVVRIDGFVRGKQNDWNLALARMSDLIAADVGKRRDLVVSGFSTTGIVEKAASEVVLMDAFQSFYKYEFHTKCGFPEITLLGTPEDWESIRTRAAVLAEYDCPDWVSRMAKPLAAFAEASRGNVDKAYWNSFFKQDNMSGGPTISGWVMELFPYLRKYGKNGYEFVVNDRIGAGWGISTSQIPNGRSAVPFVWEYYGDRIPMRFDAGFLGISQDLKTATVRPVIGWGFLETKPT